LIFQGKSLQHANSVLGYIILCSTLFH